MKWRKKPVVINAHQWSGDNWHEIVRFVAEQGGTEDTVRLQGPTSYETIRVATREGTTIANKGDWIICGVAGEFYACKPEIFDATYESPYTHPEAADAKELESQRDNLAVLVRMLVYELRNTPGVKGETLCDNAMNYLCMKGLRAVDERRPQVQRSEEQ